MPGCSTGSLSWSWQTRIGPPGLDRSDDPDSSLLRLDGLGVTRLKHAEEHDPGVEFEGVPTCNRVDRQEMPGRLAGVEFRGTADGGEVGIGQPGGGRHDDEHVPQRVEATGRAVDPEPWRAVQYHVAVRHYLSTGKQAWVAERVIAICRDGDGAKGCILRRIGDDVEVLGGPNGTSRR